MQITGTPDEFRAAIDAIEEDGPASSVPLRRVGTLYMYRKRQRPWRYFAAGLAIGFLLGLFAFAALVLWCPDSLVMRFVQ